MSVRWVFLNVVWLFLLSLSLFVALPLMFSSAGIRELVFFYLFYRAADIVVISI